MEYAAFIVSGTIKLKSMIVPNFRFYLHEEFIERWTAADGQVCYYSPTANPSDRARRFELER